MPYSSLIVQKLKTAQTKSLKMNNGFTILYSSIVLYGLHANIMEMLELQPGLGGNDQIRRKQYSLFQC